MRLSKNTNSSGLVTQLKGNMELVLKCQKAIKVSKNIEIEEVIPVDAGIIVANILLHGCSL